MEVAKRFGLFFRIVNPRGFFEHHVDVERPVDVRSRCRTGDHGVGNVLEDWLPRLNRFEVDLIPLRNPPLVIVLLPKEFLFCIETTTL